MRNDNVRLIKEQEKILKSLSNKQNNQAYQPNPEHETQYEREQQYVENNQAESHNQRRHHQERHRSEYGEESYDAQDPIMTKKQQTKLQGKFQKIKPPTYNG